MGGEWGTEGDGSKLINYSSYEEYLLNTYHNYIYPDMLWLHFFLQFSSIASAMVHTIDSYSCFHEDFFSPPSHNVSVIVVHRMYCFWYSSY